MTERASNPILEKSVHTIVLRHKEQSRIGLPRHRLTSVGTTDTGDVYVFLGSSLQVSEFVAVDKQIRQTTAGDIFRMGDTMLPDSLLEGYTEEKNIESLRRDIEGGEGLTSGPILARTDPKEPQVVRSKEGGIWAPINVAASEGWTIATDQN